MTLIKANTAELDDGSVPHPLLGSFTARLISDTGGLTQFGAFTETLAPGGKSSLKHWHAGEDEMVYMLDGCVTLHENETTQDMHPGDAACFKAGDPVGHCLENRSDRPATYLVIGTRSDGDVVTYPDHDRVLTFQRPSNTRSYTTTAGEPAGNPYQGK